MSVVGSASTEPSRVALALGTQLAWSSWNMEVAADSFWTRYFNTVGSKEGQHRIPLSHRWLPRR